MKVTLEGKIAVLDKVPFISKMWCNDGFVLFNEKGEHFVFAVDNSQQCCECFDYEFPTIRSEKMDGCTIEVTNDPDEETLKCLGVEFSSGDGWDEQSIIAVIITDNGTNEKHYGYASNIHNGYYAHSVVYGKSGGLEWESI